MEVELPNAGKFVELFDNARAGDVVVQLGSMFHAQAGAHIAPKVRFSWRRRSGRIRCSVSANCIDSERSTSV